ncbi:hypothetical protein BT93_L3501 [Corymbia citriodora subsp. variegata]|uniref:Uncharacterized protein n=1 Tax=Corymbia citriodora subsp. variegata TaxID=360336 RepID=A0A8T0CHE5_CORYI|nr:hypothetical protein BT93_L3501 [Corymbia citriodora subsp. variegata]
MPLAQNYRSLKGANTSAKHQERQYIPTLSLPLGMFLHSNRKAHYESIVYYLRQHFFKHEGSVPSQPCRPNDT